MGRFTAFQIIEEEYVTPAIVNRCPAIRFYYKIVRADGSLLYRAETLKFAVRIQNNLYQMEVVS